MDMECNTDGCSQIIVATCMHCHHDLCLKCLTRHQQPIEAQIAQLTNDMNKLLSISSITDDKIDSFVHPQVSVEKQYQSVMDDIDLWEITMTKQLNDLVSQARASVRTSFEQISFEIDEWSTEKQVQLQNLANEIGKLF